jgi:lysozyme
MIEDFDPAKMMLLRDEGDSRYPYDCGTGNRVYADSGSVTIGIGHNLDTRPISDAVRDLLFAEDWAIARETCVSLYPAYMKLSQPRRLALLNMAFNLGERRLSKFKLMNQAINDGLWHDAATEARNSLWFHQVKGRAERIAWMIEHDAIHAEYLQQ